MSTIKPALSEFGEWITESWSALYMWGTGVKDALVETLDSVKNRTELAWSKSYGNSLTEQFAKNKARIDSNIEKIREWWIFSKAYNSSKRALNQTLGRAYAWASGLAIGSVKAVPQVIWQGGWVVIDSVRGVIKAWGNMVWGIVHSTGEALSWTGKSLEKLTDITRKPEDYGKVVDFKPTKDVVNNKINKEIDQDDPKIKPLNPSKENPQQDKAAA